MKSYYINVQGGTGLNFGLSSFVSYIKENGDDNGNKDYEFNVCSPYFDIFECNSSVSTVYKPQELKDMIFDAKAADGEIVTIRLYDLSNFILKKLNYSQAWAELLKIPFTDTENGTKVTSNLNPLSKYPYLKNQVDQYKKDLNDKGFNEYAIMQFTGGQSPLVQVPLNDQKQPDWSKVPYNYENEPLKRHYPTELAQEFCDKYHDKYPNRAIILFALPNEPGPQGDYIFRAVIPYLAYYELAKEAKEIVAIDSCLQHLAAGLTKTTVIWGHSKPEHFGYSYNNNIIQKCRTDDLLYFTALGPSGAKVDYIKPDKLLDEVEE